MTSSPLTDRARHGTLLDRRQMDPFYTFLGPNPNIIVPVLVAAILLGQCLLLLLFLTFILSSRVQPRNPTLVNLVFISCLAGIPALLLFYTGNLHNPSPTFSLCLGQATLKHGTDTMFVMASLALASELYMSTKIWSDRFTAYRRVALVAIPYATFFAFSLLTAWIGARFPDSVQHQREVLWCDVYTPGLDNGIGLFGVAVVVCTIILQVLTAVSLRQAWKRAALDPEAEPARRNVSANSLLLRLAAYTIVQVTYLVITMISAVTGDKTKLLRVAFEACMPLGIFFVYGLSFDVLRVWTFTSPSRPIISAPIPCAQYALPPSLDPEAPPPALFWPPPARQRPTVPSLTRSASVASGKLVPSIRTENLGYADPQLSGFSGESTQSNLSGRTHHTDLWRWSVYTRATERGARSDARGIVSQRLSIASVQTTKPTARRPTPSVPQ